MSDMPVREQNLFVSGVLTIHNMMMDLSVEQGITDDYWEAERLERKITVAQQEAEWAEMSEAWSKEKEDYERETGTGDHVMGRDQTNTRARERIRTILERHHYENAARFEFEDQ